MYSIKALLNVFKEVAIQLSIFIRNSISSLCMVCHRKVSDRVKSGNFGHQINSDSDLVCFIFQLLE